MQVVNVNMPDFEVFIPDKIVSKLMGSSPGGAGEILRGIITGHFTDKMMRYLHANRDTLDLAALIRDDVVTVKDIDKITVKEKK